MKLDKNFILKIHDIIAMTYKGKYGNYDIKMQQKWYEIKQVQWYTCEDNNNFYICIQGSRSDQDWKDNFDFSQDKFKYNKKFKIHRGHYSQTQILFNEMKNEIMKKHIENKKIIINGHSLGGGIAQILPLFIYYEINVNLENIIIITEGAPRSFNNAIKNWFNKNIKRYIRIVNANDPVPRLPFKLTGFWKYYHVGEKLQIGNKKGISRFFPWNYWKWIKNDVNHNPLEYKKNLIKYFEKIL